MKALALFEKGVRAFQKKEWGRADELFRKILVSFPDERELLARAAMYLSALTRHLETEKRQKIRSTEEMVQRAVFLMNEGNTEEAQQLLRRCAERVRAEGRTSTTRPDLVAYLTATACALAGDAPGALQNLRQAIAWNESNRTAAANNPDFEPFLEDPRFQALLHPALPLRRRP